MKGYSGFSTRPELETKREQKAQAAAQEAQKDEETKSPAETPAADTNKPKGE